MTATDLIKLLKSLEYGGVSGESREISFDVCFPNGDKFFIRSPEISISSTGDGIAGAELCLLINELK